MMIPKGRPGAIAYIRGSDQAAGLQGVVRFYDTARGTLVTAEIYGLPENGTGFYGFHIHEGGSCEGTGFSDTGGHFNPGAAAHPGHAGDLPQLLYCKGLAFLAVLTDRFRVQDVIGRTVVIHAHGDDFTTQPAGNAGQKIGCGVIGL